MAEQSQTESRDPHTLRTKTRAIPPLHLPTPIDYWELALRFAYLLLFPLHLLSYVLAPFSFVFDAIALLSVTSTPLASRFLFFYYLSPVCWSFDCLPWQCLCLDVHFLRLSLQVFITTSVLLVCYSCQPVSLWSLRWKLRRPVCRRQVSLCNDRRLVAIYYLSTRGDGSPVFSLPCKNYSVNYSQNAPVLLDGAWMGDSLRLCSVFAVLSLLYILCCLWIERRRRAWYLIVMTAKSWLYQFPHDGLTLPPSLIHRHRPSCNLCKHETLLWNAPRIYPKSGMYTLVNPFFCNKNSKDMKKDGARMVSSQLTTCTNANGMTTRLTWTYLRSFYISVRSVF